jgi:hypothetical protein
VDRAHDAGPLFGIIMKLQDAPPWYVRSLCRGYQVCAQQGGLYDLRLTHPPRRRYR